MIIPPQANKNKIEDPLKPLKTLKNHKNKKNKCRVYKWFLYMMNSKIIRSKKIKRALKIKETKLLGKGL